MLLVGAALLLQSFVRLQQVRPGFDPEGVITARISLPQRPVSGCQRARGASGADCWNRSTACHRYSPWRSGSRRHSGPVCARAAGRGTVPKRPVHATAGIGAVEHMVSPDYFQALGVPLLAGRSFGQQDGSGSPLVAVVSESVARQLWADKSPVGQTLDWNGRQHEVVGVVGDIRGADGRGCCWRRPGSRAQRRRLPLRDPVPAEDDDVAGADRRRAVRDRPGDCSSRPGYRSGTAGLSGPPPARLARRECCAAAVHHDVERCCLPSSHFCSPQSVSTVCSRIRSPSGRRKLACAWRSAPSAPKSCASCCEAAWPGPSPASPSGCSARSRSAVCFGTLLFEVGARDPITYSTVGVMLALVAMLACYIPAARATRIDPVIALRTE